MSQEMLAAQVRRVAEARAKMEAAKAAYVAKEEAFYASVADLEAEKVAATEAVLAEEMALRSLAVAHYDATGEKKVVPGVEVKVLTERTYPKDKAFAWAKEKGLAIVPESLDTKAFDKIIAALPELPEFVTVITKARADVSKNIEVAA